MVDLLLLSEAQPNAKECGVIRIDVACHRA